MLKKQKGNTNTKKNSVSSPNYLVSSSPHNPNELLPHILYTNEVIVDGAGQRVGIARSVDTLCFLDLYNSYMKGFRQPWSELCA